MKKLLLTTITFLSFLTSKSQSYFGYLNDNYSGVHSVINNPANIVDSRFNTDINLVSASYLLTNNYFSGNLNDIFKGNKFDKSSSKTPLSSNSFLINSDILGPSFMFNLKPKHAIAFFSRVRGIGHLTNLDGKLIDDFNNRVSNTNYIISDQNFSIASNAWSEFGLSYATVLLDKGQHFLKGGLSIKYLAGFYSAYAKVNDYGVEYVNGTDSNTSNYKTTGTIETGNLKSFDSYDSPGKIEGNGFGGDIGFT